MNLIKEIEVKKHIDIGIIILIITVATTGVGFILSMEANARVESAQQDARMEITEKTLSKVVDVQSDLNSRVKRNEQFRIEMEARNRYGSGGAWGGVEGNEKK